MMRSRTAGQDCVARFRARGADAGAPAVGAVLVPVTRFRVRVTSVVPAAAAPGVARFAARAFVAGRVSGVAAGLVADGFALDLGGGLARGLAADPDEGATEDATEDATEEDASPILTLTGLLPQSSSSR